MLIETSSLKDKLDAMPTLRPFPTIAARVLSICNSADADAMDLAEVMQCDPALTLRLLQLANSAQYGFSGEIGSVEHAIVVLGFRAVRNLALTISASSVFRSGEPGIKIRDDLWGHSVGCAAVARQLAPHVSRITPDEAFLAGIMHDVGKLVLFDLVPDEYFTVTQRAKVGSIVDVEERGFGITHEQVGERCGLEWGLPPEINSAIAHRHAPLSATDDQELVGVISVSNFLAHAWCVGSQQEHIEVQQDELPPNNLPLDDQVLQQVRADAPAEFEMLRRICAE